jgi:hypothetical protein
MIFLHRTFTTFWSIDTDKHHLLNRLMTDPGGMLFQTLLQYCPSSASSGVFEFSVGMTGQFTDRIRFPYSGTITAWLVNYHTKNL